MRGAIGRWTPEGRVYFDNRYHRRRCYRLSYRSAPHTVNRQQIEHCVCVCVCVQCVCFIYACIEMLPFVMPAYTAGLCWLLTPLLPHHFAFLFTLHLSFSCRTRFQAIMWLLYHKWLIPENRRLSERGRGGELSNWMKSFLQVGKLVQVLLSCSRACISSVSLSENVGGCG